MITISIATGIAGVIIGTVSLTGAHQFIGEFVEVLSSGNLENLSFVLKISEKLNLNSKILIKTLNKFKGLKYRQQIIYENKNLTIINDSKSTSFASSENLLKNLFLN